MVFSRLARAGKLLWVQNTWGRNRLAEEAGVSEKDRETYIKKEVLYIMKFIKTGHRDNFIRNVLYDSLQFTYSKGKVEGEEKRG